jgi:hypothetical protein
LVILHIQQRIYIKKIKKIQLYMQKLIWTPSRSAGANSETPNHAFAPQILIPNICVISTLRLVSEPWLVRVCAKPPLHCPNSDHSQSIISSPRLARQAASSCTLHSTENLIKKKCSHRWSMGRAVGVLVPRPLEGGFKPSSGEKKN